MGDKWQNIPTCFLSLLSLHQPRSPIFFTPPHPLHSCLSPPITLTPLTCPRVECGREWQHGDDVEEVQPVALAVHGRHHPVECLQRCIRLVQCHHCGWGVGVAVGVVIRVAMWVVVWVAVGVAVGLAMRVAVGLAEVRVATMSVAALLAPPTHDMQHQLLSSTNPTTTTISPLTDAAPAPLGLPLRHRRWRRVPRQCRGVQHDHGRRAGVDAAHRDRAQKEL